jgi:hypothetical protein
MERSTNERKKYNKLNLNNLKIKVEKSNTNLT